MNKGTPTLKTSSRSLIMYSPFRENITRIVKRSATSVIGLIFGINFS